MDRRVDPAPPKAWLQTGGWQHPMVLPEMVRYYATGAIGEAWDRPTPEQLLEVAAQMGDADARAR